MLRSVMFVVLYTRSGLRVAAPFTHALGLDTDNSIHRH